MKEMSDKRMKTGKRLKKAALFVLLTVPFVYEKKDGGGFRLKAVLYDIVVNKNGSERNYSFNLGGIFREQIAAVKALAADVFAAAKAKKAEIEANADDEDEESIDEAAEQAIDEALGNG